MSEKIICPSCGDEFDPEAELEPVDLEKVVSGDPDPVLVLADQLASAAKILRSQRTEWMNSVMWRIIDVAGQLMDQGADVGVKSSPTGMGYYVSRK